MDEKTPCVFVLSRGADPMGLLMKFAASVGMEHSLAVVSLGKGQGPRAEEVIRVRRRRCLGHVIVKLSSCSNFNMTICHGWQKCQAAKVLNLVSLLPRVSW